MRPTIGQIVQLIDVVGEDSVEEEVRAAIVTAVDEKQPMDVLLAVFNTTNIACGILAREGSKPGNWRRIPVTL